MLPYILIGNGSDFHERKQDSDYDKKIRKW